MFFENILFPKHCLSCGKIGNVLCSRCKQETANVRTQVCVYCFKPSLAGFTHHSCKHKYGLDELISVYRYDGVIRKVLKKVKYKLTRKSFFWFLDAVFDDIKKRVNVILKIHNNIVLCPIPLHTNRYKQRGFNQAEIISNFLSSKFNIPTDILLSRIIDTKPQSNIKKHTERRRNIQGSFLLERNVRVEGKTVVLVDDIVTSGHTLREAGYILKKAGAKKVVAFTIARAY